VLAALAWLVRNHHDRLRVEGDWPITVAEVRTFLPEAARLQVDAGPRGGYEVIGSAGKRIGYVVRTMPQSRAIVGYSGPSDVLVVFDAEDKGLGAAIRHSYDTPSHVDDVRHDFIFMESWNGRSWEEIAEITDLASAKIYAVSGATRTSEAVAQSVVARVAQGTAAAVSGRTWSWSWRDFVLFGFLGMGCLFAYWKNPRWQRWRWLYSLATMVGLGLWMGDLLAQSLLVGWMETRVPWSATPGLVILATAAFVLPWATRQPVYCQFICPHGNLQRWTMKLLPARWKRPMGEDLKWLSRAVPPLLLLVVLFVSFLRLDFDLAGIEPFDAYVLRSAGWATLLVAGVGLLVSLWIPMAYCKYGCPTGWLLEFVRRRGGKEHFSGRDWIGVALLAVALILYLTPLSFWLE
jgi:NosR/NirI family transcriptional regulator, nitrous oxide reductase regulator